MAIAPQPPPKGHTVGGPLIAAPHANRPPRPHRLGRATSRATGPTFAVLSQIGHVKTVTKSQSDTAPFRGPDAADLKKLYGHYAWSSQECIAAALTIPAVVQGMDRSQGTAPELVTVGWHVRNGFHYGVDLFWQTSTFRDPIYNPAGHPYPVDVQVIDGGGMKWDFLVDGVEWHLKTQQEITRDIRRNQNLQQFGDRVIVVTDLICQDAETFGSYLQARGAP